MTRRVQTFSGCFLEEAIESLVQNFGGKHGVELVFCPEFIEDCSAVE